MKKNILLYLSFVPVFFAFVVTSFFLRLNSKNQKMLSGKLKSGALLLTLTSVFNSCSGPEPERVTCYDAAVSDSNETVLKNDSITADTIIAVPDSGKITSPLNRATCYGAPLNLYNSKNE